MIGKAIDHDTRATRLAAIFSATLLCFLVLWSFPAAAQSAETPSSPPKGQLLFPLGDPDEGRKLFISKGCVICHAVNGIGGRVGPPLDLDISRPYLNVFDFAARMWRGASTMIVLQEMQLGYQIEFSGNDLAHIAAFLSSRESQQALTREQIPPNVRQWMLEDVYRHLEDEVIQQ
jgi:cytochrome c